MMCTPLRQVALWLMLLVPGLLVAQELWQSASLPRQDQWADGQPLPTDYQAYRLDPAQLDLALAAAPYFQVSAGKQQSGVTLPVPMPDGAIIPFEVFLRPVMHPDLANRFPEIRSYFGFNPLQPGQWLHLDRGPNGVRLLVTRPDAPAWYLDPFDHLDPDAPLVAYRNTDHPGKTGLPFTCHTVADALWPADAEDDLRSSANDGTLRLYRLALACTGEYGAYHGGTVPQTLAAMATTLNRVNGIFERDFGIRMELVANNDQLIFLNGANDPFDNGNGNSMLVQNQQLCDNVIGSANYDVGHVFATAGGGLATLFSPCNNNTKARAFTGLSNPKGDAFDVDYVAHEMGHQFGCNHTFNNSCNNNRNNATAWEPGSGSSIMSYAGICTPNVQNSSLAFFHGGSMLEARNFIVNGNGNSCPEKISSANQGPVVEAGLSYTIPRSTPFELEAEAFDPDEDTLSYSWEQFDNQIATMPPVGSNTGGPLFRSLAPLAQPLRSFPNLTAILTNTSPTWEVLPSVGRNLQFRVTVRDNAPGHGRWAQDNLQLTVAPAAGPFLVTSPNSSLTWTIGDTVNVTWAVAGTDLAPVSCPQVNIYLSTNGGFSFPHLLAGPVANNGAFPIVVPNLPGNANRIKIKGHNQVFFDLSNTNFAIAPPAEPSFLATGLQDSLPFCRTGADTLSLAVILRPLSGFQGSILPEAFLPDGWTSDLPAAWELGPDPDTFSFRIWPIDVVSPLPEAWNLRLSAPGVQRQLSYQLWPFELLDSAVLPEAPTDNLDGQPLLAAFRWHPLAGAAAYRLIVADNPLLTNPLHDLSTRDTFLVLPLAATTIYYWQVIASNPCGPGPASALRALRTALELCDTRSPETLPVAIPADQPFTFNSIVPMPGTGTVSRVQASVDVQHAAPAELSLRLLHGTGLGRNLYFKDCNSGQDIDALFSDQGQPLICTGSQPAVTGHLLPSAGPLTLFNGLQAAGNWALRIIDDANGNGGSLRHWSLTVCRMVPLPPAPLALMSDTLRVPYLGEAVLTPMLLEVSDTLDGAIHITLREAPQEGTLYLGAEALTPGMHFTKDELESLEIRYVHNQGAILEDHILVDILNVQTLGWRPGIGIPVRIRPELQASASLLQPIICQGDSTGWIRAEVTGAKAPLSYRILPGGDWQPSADFTDLGPGIYEIEVRDAHGFTATAAPLTLSDPEALSLEYLLYGDSLLLFAAGGEAPYLFQVDGQSLSEAAFLVSGPGTYLFGVTDARGCQRLMARELQPLSALVEVTGNPCAGDSLGTIAIQAGGGIPPWRYRLNNGPWTTSGVFDALPAGAYLAELSDSSDFIRMLGTFDLQDPAPLVLEGINISAFTALLAAQGGTPPLLYSREGGTGQDSPLFEGLPAGVLTFYVEDAQGCRDTLVLDVLSSVRPTEAATGPWQVFPNPAGAMLEVRGKPQQAGPYHWYIADLLGRTLVQGMSAENGWQVALPPRPSGLYYLRIQHAAQVQTILLILE